ncbi:F0F1 ATP synthase subunit delta [Paenibacillus sp. J2TS4]|uniref:F0F1 ATP synthase subunit delta n=1 Tax=Paenibacillus sp. J2TS4 TaxID=2807194 RepID=UPI001B2A12BD|nr:F0F1 ATP synthase subunit delta [Paenibacillus sp. J2TS4]GIP35549.1 ATP synthase subunit delta [Paenibacillus sp. J2TS4]
MSSDTIVAKRYAKALFEIAQSRSLVSQVEEELKVVVAVIEQNDDFQQFLLHPKYDLNEKINLLSRVFKDNLSDAVFNTLCLLIERGRGMLFHALLDYYVSIANEAMRQADAIVYSPAALSEQESQAIAAQFGKMIGKTIRVDNVVDSSLIGGIQVRIGDRLYDGSLSGKLARMEKTLKQTQAM